MPTQPTSTFHCPHCGVAYKIVRVEADAAAAADDKVHCRNCDGELDGRDGAFILKYFLVGPSRKPRRKK
jgi:transcription elongation factor Elf1